MHTLRLAGLIFALLLTGCEAKAKVKVSETVSATVDSVTETSQAVVAKTATPLVLTAKEVTEDLTPAPATPPAQIPKPHTVHPDGVALIIKWEVSSKSIYNAKYQGVVCPKGASGPTWGIGYDGGHQTQAQIRKDWSWHPQVEKMVTASGKVGDAACRAWRAQNLDIRVSYEDAIKVFEYTVLPAYEKQAARALSRGWATYSEPAQAADVSLGYNRGWSFTGDRRKEMRDIRDNCVPNGNPQCQANALIAMCRHWVGQDIYTGICNRRKDEAKLSLKR